MFVMHAFEENTFALKREMQFDNILEQSSVSNKHIP